MVNLSVESGVGLALAALWLFGVIDAAVVQPMSAWEGAGRSRTAWILIQLVFGPLGSLVYILGVRRELARARRAVPISHEEPHG